MKEEKYSNRELPNVSEFIGSLQLQRLKINSSKFTKDKCKRGNIERLTIKTQIGYRRSLYRQRQIPYHKQWNAKECDRQLQSARIENYPATWNSIPAKTSFKKKRM